MPPRNESLQTRVTRKIIQGETDEEFDERKAKQRIREIETGRVGIRDKEPELPYIILNKLRSPLLFKAKNELARNIQRTYRNKRFRIKRQGSKMTTYEMRRQLCDFWCDIDPEQTFDEFVMGVLYPVFNNLNKSGLVSEDIKILLDNLSRPLLEPLYNRLDSTEQSEITIDKMRRQLCDFWCDIDPDQTFDEFVMGVLYPVFNNLNKSGLVSEDIKILLDNLSRPLLEPLYNNLDSMDSPSKQRLANRSEDIRYINNQLFFPQTVNGGKKYRKSKKSKKSKKTIKYKN